MAAAATASRSKTRRASVRYSGHVGEKEFREAIAIALNYLGKQYQKEVDPKYAIPTVDDFLQFMAHTKASLTPTSSRKNRALSKTFQGSVAKGTVVAAAAAGRRQEGGGIFEAILILLSFAFGGNLVRGRTRAHTLMNILNFLLYAFMLRDIVMAIADDPYPVTVSHLSERFIAGLYTPSWSDPLRYGLFMTLPPPMAAYYDVLYEQYSHVYTNIYIFLLPLNRGIFEAESMSHTGLLLGAEIGSLVTGWDSFYILAKAIKLVITNTQIFNITFALPVAHGLRALRVPGADAYLLELVEKIRKPVAWILPPSPAPGPTGGAGTSR